MARKRKAEQAAEEAEFRQQTSNFRNPNIRRANFHIVTGNHMVIDASVLARGKASNSHTSETLSSDVAPCDEVSHREDVSQAEKRTQASSDNLMLGVI
jgi:hypothetical protein